MRMWLAFAGLLPRGTLVLPEQLRGNYASMISGSYANLGDMFLAL